MLRLLLKPLRTTKIPLRYSMHIDMSNYGSIKAFA